MSLSGSLRDFDISYIFQLISQESKTGKLSITFRDETSYVIFKNGSVILAATEQQNLQLMINNYLLYVKEYQEKEINELLSCYSDDIHSLVNAIIENEYMSSDELSVIVERGIEDITCNLFLWKEGKYKFDILESVEEYSTGECVISSDFITMEAARRMDETERFRTQVRNDHIFIHAGKDTETESKDKQKIIPLDDFTEYIYNQIDGTNSTELLCDQSFFSEYQVYNALFELLSDKRIVPLPYKISKSINEALRRSFKKDESPTPRVFISTIITLTFIAFIYFIGNILLNRIIFAESINVRNVNLKEINLSISNKKIAIARLQYHGIYGVQASSFKDFVKTGILMKRDFADYLNMSKRKRSDNKTSQ